MSKTFLQLRTELNAAIFASGVPENLLDDLTDGNGNAIAPAPLTQIYQEALAEIAKWVPCERTRNVNAIKFCNTYYSCGMTVVEAPRGIVNRMYTLASEDGVDNWCDPVFIRPEEWPAAQCAARNNPWNVGVPENAGQAGLPLGFKRAESSTDVDINAVQVGRARTGIYSRHDEKLWVSPWLQSNEKLVYEWTGIKQEWKDDDLVNDEQDYRKAVKLYVQYGYARDYGDPADADRIHRRLPDGRYTGTFDEALADLMWECRERTKKQPQVLCDNTSIEIFGNTATGMSYFIPSFNAACGCVRHGNGVPSNLLGNDGDIYIDGDNRKSVV